MGSPLGTDAVGRGGGQGESALTTAFRDAARFALRDRTAAHHARIDAAFGRLDLASADGLATFLSAQHIALSVAEPVLSRAPGLSKLPARLDAISHDLAALGRAGPADPGAPFPLAGADRDPLGVAYVVGGSALGGRILSRRRLASSDPGVREAGAFMDDPRMMAYWRAVLAALRSVRPEPDRLDGLARAAVATFDLFEDALQRVKRHGLD